MKDREKFWDRVFYGWVVLCGVVGLAIVLTCIYIILHFAMKWW